jgi:hypothetical protein
MGLLSAMNGGEMSIAMVKANLMNAEAYVLKAQTERMKVNSDLKAASQILGADFTSGTLDENVNKYFNFMYARDPEKAIDMLTGYFKMKAASADARAKTDPLSGESIEGKNYLLAKDVIMESMANARNMNVWERRLQNGKLSYPEYRAYEVYTDYLAENFESWDKVPKETRAGITIDILQYEGEVPVVKEGEESSGGISEAAKRFLESLE